MLLAISFAGWWKFHRDLYLEEEAVLASLAKEGCATAHSVARDRLEDPGASDDGLENGPFVRIQELAIVGRPSPALLRRAASLPNLKMLYVRWDPPHEPRTGPSPAHAANELVGGAAPTFATAEFVEADLERPQPTGERMNEADHARTLEAVRFSWEKPSTAPASFVRSVAIRSSSPGFDDSETRETFARDGEAALTYRWDGGDIELHAMQIDDGEALYTLYKISDWFLSYRHDEETWGYGRMRHHKKENLVHWPYGFDARTDSVELAHVEAVERIDEARVRLTFRPFERPGPGSFPGSTLSIRDAAIVLREDLDWLPESLRETEGETTRTERRRYERLGDYVVPIEVLARRKAEHYDFGTEHVQFAWRIDPTFEPGTFSPNRFLAEPVPPPQAEPVWRWYYFTFAAGLALSLFLAVRLLIKHRTKRRRAIPASDA